MISFITASISGAAAGFFASDQLKKVFPSSVVQAFDSLAHLSWGKLWGISLVTVFGKMIAPKFIETTKVTHYIGLALLFGSSFLIGNKIGKEYNVAAAEVTKLLSNLEKEDFGFDDPSIALIQGYAVDLMESQRGYFKKAKETIKNLREVSNHSLTNGEESQLIDSDRNREKIREIKEKLKIIKEVNELVVDTCEAFRSEINKTSVLDTLTQFALEKYLVDHQNEDGWLAPCTIEDLPLECQQAYYLNVITNSRRFILNLNETHQITIQVLIDFLQKADKLVKQLMGKIDTPFFPAYPYGNNFFNNLLGKVIWEESAKSDLRSLRFIAGLTCPN